MKDLISTEYQRCDLYDFNMYPDPSIFTMKEMIPENGYFIMTHLCSFSAGVNKFSLILCFKVFIWEVSKAEGGCVNNEYPLRA